MIEIKNRSSQDSGDALPLGTFRVLWQGGIIGCFYELELDGDTIVLTEKPLGEKNEFQVFADKELATRLARAEIAKRYGSETACAAKFVVAWGGRL